MAKLLPFTPRQPKQVETDDAAARLTRTWVCARGHVVRVGSACGACS